MRNNTKKQTEIAMLVAIVVVLTILCNFIKFGPFSITLALAPIVVGASIYGPATGALLGTVFGAVVLLTGFLGWDGGVVMMLLGINWWCIPICLAKGAAAGYVSGVVFRAFEEKSIKTGTLLAGIAAPVVNTGLFILGMLLCYMPTLQEWAGGQAIFSYVIFGLTGVNFLIEVLVNVVLSGAISAIIRYRKKTGSRQSVRRPAAVPAEDSVSVPEGTSVSVPEKTPGSIQKEP